MVGFVCKDCNYRFETKSENTSKVCPYCGHSGIVKEKDAEELLNDITD